MIIETNRLDYKKDLEEVVYLFTDGANIEIKHFEKNDGNTFFNTFDFEGKIYDFKNQKDCKNQLEVKRFEKRFSKLGLYKILSEKFNIKNPWGALTGIRPVKMAYQAGDNFEKEFTSVFEVTPKKIQLVKEIIDAQKGIVDLKGEYSDFFISIPFCPTRCAYCSFISEEISKSKYVSEYAKTLAYEIENTKELATNIRSIYIGGGTPVSLPNSELITILNSTIDLASKVKEYTVEAGRPDVITEEKLKILKDYGVTRICVNPQTFLDKTLKVIGRNHTAKDIIDKYEIASKYGFVVNMDIIAGLQGESFDDFKFTVDTVMKLNPDNFTAHTLCLKRGAKIRDSVERLSVEDIEKMVDYAHDRAIENGYNPYYLYRQKYAAGNFENVGFAKKGKECIYNIDVMEETSSNPACGANAVSKKVIPSENRLERYGAPKDVKTYISKIDQIIQEKKQLFLTNP